MADKKISDLTAASTPLAGTEVLPIVQSSTTKKVSVADLTAGRAVSSAGFTALRSDTSDASVNLQNSTGLTVLTQGGDGNFYFLNYAAKDIIFGTSGAELARFFNSSKNLRLTAGNLAFQTAGKGIDFSANGGDVLTQYDEGTWDPVVQFGVANTGMTFSTKTGSYTRIGRLVTIHVTLVFTAKGSSTGNFRFSLPFTSATKSAGSMGFNYAWATMPSGGVTFMTDGAYAYAMAANLGSYMTDTYFNDVTAINAITITYPV